MKIGFIILSHKQPDTLFTKLLSRLSQFPNYVIGLHHDFTQSSFSFELLDKFNIHLALPCRQTQWGHASKVPATLDAFKRIFELSSPPDWYITVSPNCYPIKSIDYITQFLEQSKFDAYVNLNPIQPESKIANCRNKYRFLYSKELFQIPFFSKKGKFYYRTVRYPVLPSQTPFSNSFQPYFGSDWMMFNHNAAKKLYAANLEKSNLLHYLAQINRQPNTLISPDEVVIQTFLGNSKDLKVYSDYYRFIDWKDSKDYHPNTITIKHWESIKNSQALFARKFSLPDSREVLEKIDRELIQEQKLIMN